MTDKGYGHRIAELMMTLCIDCLRNRRVEDHEGEARYECAARETRYFENSSRRKDLDHRPKTCTSRISDPFEYLDQLKQIRAYSLRKRGLVLPPELNAEIEVYERICAAAGGPSSGWQEAYHESTHRDDIKSGGGEKADRTNKIFGPDRLKDNRPRYPWTDEDMKRVFGKERS